MHKNTELKQLIKDKIFNYLMKIAMNDEATKNIPITIVKIKRNFSNPRRVV